MTFSMSACMFCDVSSLLSKLTANQRLLLHHVIVVLRNVSAHESVTRMTSANLAVCVAPALLWKAPCAPRLSDTGDEHLMHDVGRLAVVIQRIIDAENSAFFNDDLVYPTPFADLNVTSPVPSSLRDSDTSNGYKRCKLSRLLHHYSHRMAVCYYRHVHLFTLTATSTVWGLPVFLLAYWAGRGECCVPLKCWSKNFLRRNSNEK